MRTNTHKTQPLLCATLLTSSVLCFLRKHDVLCVTFFYSGDLVNKKACFTSLTDNWNTPESLYLQLHAEFKFDFDPCPANHFKDGLNINWGRSNFVNPPFSNWQEWVEKGCEEYLKGKIVVFLLAARTDTKAFHEIIIPYASEIRFIKGRLKFGGAKRGAPFPSMVVIFE